MIRAALKEDYLKNQELLKEVKELYDNPAFQRVIETMRVYTRSYMVPLVATDAGALGYKAGFSDGAQRILDDMLSLDAMPMRQELQPTFTADPTE